MNYRVVSVLMALVLGGCASSQSKYTQEDFDSYFDTMIVKNNIYPHKKNGVVYQYNQEPFKADNEDCTYQSYTGLSLMYGTKTISDPKILQQHAADNANDVINLFKKKALQFPVLNDKVFLLVDF